jgi:hypothetical protein
VACQRYFFLTLKFPCLIHQKLQEEREKRLEETFEADLDNAVEDRYGKKDDAPEEGYVGVPGKKTKETVLLLMQLLTHLTLPRKKKNVLMNRRYYECISKH